ncbi:hypothetical protein D9619_010192 [Psilocybe cf. subviscida]|uniref:Uncharacterized protein n=1 Tax=Psilocybe cf. subviscida TaxID=2480587 RepID=A0A8H5AS44_9AGAR|nr:hypothetical protein D9619_010192 [Psilocybe cf. subviscida]
MRDLRNKFCLIDLDLMVTMLRLGKKYDCERFKTQALEQLRLAFPNKFYQCENIWEGNSVDGATYDDFADDYEFYLLDVALELGIQTILPLAFFTCLDNCPTSQFLDGSYDAGPGRSGILPSHAREALLQAKEKIIEDISDEVYAWWKQAKPHVDCTTKKSCTDAIRKDAIRMIGAPHLRELFIPKVSIRSMKELCRTCKDHGATSTENGRRQVFDKLPSYFGLSDWADLKDFDD